MSIIHNKTKKVIDTTKGGVNKTLLYIFLGLLVFGIMMVFDASVYKAHELKSNPYYFLIQHLIWIVAGGISGVILYFIDYKVLRHFALPIFIVSTIFLILVLIAGDTLNGASRWFEIFGIRIQPAEFAKLTTIIFLASLFSKPSKEKDLTKAYKQRFNQFVIVTLSVLGLVILEPDMGTAIIIATYSYLIFFLSGEDHIHFFKTSLLSLGFFVLGIIAVVIAPYRFERLTTYLHLLFKGTVDNPTGSGYQIQQILIGIGSSGFWGKGFGQSRQRFGYLVENTAFTDSIFAVVLEEYGFASALLFVGVWLVVLWQGIKISQRIEDKFGSLLVLGITIWLVTQAFLNMAANVALIPLTGIPLPFLTYGGSNTIVTLASVGLLLNISRYAKTETK